MPALMVIGLLQLFAPHAPGYIGFLIYGVAMVVSVAAVRPWIVR
ncbi:hypothetical protein [Caulobacter sp. 602-2]|nr:hypothetical protein [Caulobacter sp. 602-2]